MTFLLVTCSIAAFGQAVKEMHPDLGYLVDKSAAGETAFKENLRKCEVIWRTLKGPADVARLTKEQKAILENCDETVDNYWQIIGNECSWYCGGGQDTNSASSSLMSAHGINYSPNNIHDLDFQTAWIEGVPGYGIGESITYHFPPQNPRITEIIVVNGYVKSEQAWNDNSRVKKLKMYIGNSRSDP